MSGLTLNQKPSESVAILDAIAPVSQAAGTVTTGWVDASVFFQLRALIMTGVLGAAATVDAKLQQATDNIGTGVKDITNKSITQIVKASGDNKQATISMKSADLDTEGGFRYVRLSITVGAAASLVGGTVEGFGPRLASAAAFNNVSVVQNV